MQAQLEIHVRNTSLNCLVIPKICLDLHSIFLLDLFYRLHHSCLYLHRATMGVGKRPALLSKLHLTLCFMRLDKVSLLFTKQLDMSQKLTYDAGPLKSLQTGIVTHRQVIRCNQDIKQWGFICCVKLIFPNQCPCSLVTFIYHSIEVCTPLL
jgi:hypothetical protein